MGKHYPPDNVLTERTQAMKQRLIQNAIAASGIANTVAVISMGLWWYTVPSDVVATVVVLGALILMVLITTARELLEAYERTLPKKRRRIRMKYDSRGMHTDSQRLGYVSAETIREVCKKMNTSRKRYKS